MVDEKKPRPVFWVRSHCAKEETTWFYYSNFFKISHLLLIVISLIIYMLTTLYLSIIPYTGGECHKGDASTTTGKVLSRSPRGQHHSQVVVRLFGGGVCACSLLQGLASAILLAPLGGRCTHSMMEFVTFYTIILFCDFRIVFPTLLPFCWRG